MKHDSNLWILYAVLVSVLIALVGTAIVLALLWLL